MSIVGTILIILIVSTLNIVCFFIGAKVGQTVIKEEPLKVPNLNPLEAYRKYQTEKHLRLQSEADKILMENIENFNGTEIGQKDIPSV